MIVEAKEKKNKIILDGDDLVNNQPTSEIEIDPNVNLIALTDREEIPHPKRRKKSRIRKTKTNKLNKPSKFFTTIDAYQEPNLLSKKLKRVNSSKKD